MNLRQLEIFVAVVECGQISKAAEKLFIAQPSVSQAIIELESFYQISLFDRLNKRLFLTSLGKQLYERVKMALTNIHELDDFLKDHSKINRLKVGSTVTIGSSILPSVIQKFTDIYNIPFKSILVGNTQFIVQSILNNTLDIAIIEGEVSNSNLSVEKVCEDEIIFVGRSAEIKDLEIPNFIVREQGSGTRKLVLDKLKEFNLHYENLWEISDIESIKKLLMMTDSVTAISKKLVQYELNEGILFECTNLKIVRNFFIIYHKDKILNSELKLFINEIREILSE